MSTVPGVDLPPPYVPGTVAAATPPRPRRGVVRVLFGAFPTVVSCLSLLVAIVSVAFAYSATQDAYVSDRRTELIGLVGDLNESAGDGQLDEATEIRIAQAVWLVGTVPDVPAAVYRQIAAAIVAETPAYEEKALPLLDEAMIRATAENDEYEQVAVLRVRAQVHEAQGEVATMRADFAEAVALSDGYDGPNVQRRHTVPAFTHVFWGLAEVRAGDCSAARDQLDSAQAHAAVITGSNLDDWIASLAAAVDVCGSG